MRNLQYKFKTTPYKHQLSSWGMMLDHFKRGEKEFALLKEMGCGKSKVLIDCASYLYDNGYIQGLLVVCPNGVKGTWVNEIETHMADHVERNVVMWTGNKTKKHEQELLSLFVSDATKIRFKILIMAEEAFALERGK